MLNAARFMVVFVGLTLGILLFSWAYEWYGLLPATLGLLLYTLEPNLLAHASLVTTDLGATCLISVPCMRSGESPGAPRR